MFFAWDARLRYFWNNSPRRTEALEWVSYLDRFVLRTIQKARTFWCKIQFFQTYVLALMHLFNYLRFDCPHFVLAVIHTSNFLLTHNYCFITITGRYLVELAMTGFKFPTSRADPIKIKVFLIYKTFQIGWKFWVPNHNS